MPASTLHVSLQCAAGCKLVQSVLLSCCPAGLEDVTLGSLEDLRRATKGGMDPNGLGAARLASDVLWSDPVGGEQWRLWQCRDAQQGPA